MNVINGGGQKSIAGCVPGEMIVITLITGHTEMVIYSKRDKEGIEGFIQNQKNQPPVFYPFGSILRIKKYSDIEGV